ncbi:hypothetical protein BST61_g5850 [Cercospora zeina]
MFTSTLILTALAAAQIYALPDPLTRATAAQADAPTAATTQKTTKTSKTKKSSTTAPPNVTGLLLFNNNNNNQPVTGFDASLLCADSSDSTYILQCASTSAPNALCSSLTSVATHSLPFLPR